MSNGSSDKTDWTRYVPDVRVWVMLGFFSLAFYLLDMVRAQPTLLDKSPFMMLATAVIGSGGLGAIVAFLYGGTKTGSSVMESQSAALTASASPSSPIHVEVAPVSPVEPPA